MTCSVWGTPKCCQYPATQALNRKNWGDWVLIDLPPDVPLVYLLERGRDGGLYRVKVSRRASVDNKLKMLISPADLMYSGCDYPHVMIQVDAPNNSTSFTYIDHYSLSASGKRFGKREVKTIQAVRPFLAQLLPTLLRKEPTIAISIAQSLGYNFITGKRGIF